MSDKKRCAGRVWDSGHWHSWQCTHPAKHGDYCGQHSPEKKAERAARRGPSKFERESAMRQEYRDALDAVLREARGAAYHTGPLALRDALEEFDAVTKRVPGYLR